MRQQDSLKRYVTKATMIKKRLKFLKWGSESYNSS